MITPIREADHRTALRAGLRARAAGEVPLIGDERWSAQHWAQILNDIADRELPEGTAWATFTSGSAARPRVVLRSAASWEVSFATVDALYGLAAKGSERDAVLIPVHPVSSMAVYAAAHAQWRGMEFTTAAGHRLQAEDLDGPTLMHGTPWHLRELVDLMEAGARCSIGSVLIGGAALDPALTARARALGLRTVSYFGAAELSLVAADTGSGMRAVDGVELQICDGVLWVRTPQLALTTLGDGGSWRRQQGWASVGDRAELTEDGTLHLHGRDDDAVLTAGATVVPADVEAVIAAFETVEAVLVLGEPDPLLGQRLVAYVKPRGSTGAHDTPDHEALDHTALIRAVRAQLAPAQWPRHWRIVEHLPRTGSGKVRRLSPEEAAALPRRERSRSR
ncbi:ANL family adenylate-forming protein [Nesterenkonia aerolata]|uniref:Fatty acid--CoA ligase family protein n=1 Tax=Nesterenkonia aerolata TaxID=3074079 RepID=A0ABU2DPB1_9MICC|nr:fatty acid--CoA ligase family protein [Nesterenkonia sp. LY-0111]MDR8018348.1 fatty acid--CoA ligase family protein [Nesterenkonia sp. LY-0111]